jgi:hypothetical protein
MAQICIPTPSLSEFQTVDVEVTIDGKPQRSRYRVETLHWPSDEDARLQALREFIAARGDEWLLVQIGAPASDCVPLLFRLRSAGANPTTQEENR